MKKDRKSQILPEAWVCELDIDCCSLANVVYRVLDYNVAAFHQVKVVHSLGSQKARSLLSLAFWQRTPNQAQRKQYVP